MPHSDTFKQKAQRCKETSLSRALTNSDKEFRYGGNRGSKYRFVQNVAGLEDTIEAARARGHLYKVNKKYESVRKLTGAGYFNGRQDQEEQNEQQVPQHSR